MYNMTEVEHIIRVETNNFCVKLCDDSKKTYAIECKKMDDLLIEYHQTDNIERKQHLSGDIMTQKGYVILHYEMMLGHISRNGDMVYDTSMIKKKRFSIINEELIQKAMSPARLARHLQLGGDTDDF